MVHKWLVEVIVCDYENAKEIRSYQVQTLEDDKMAAIEVAKYLAKQDKPGFTIKSIHLTWIERRTE
ncbi:hypothetical protein [Listeria seeligeri]|uniref:hypothetical protein n=1 Tax=Listeria seeligeri TaxID=1640 RepID=UPI0022EBE304|nr:hypothetical protein [Listeria seeligeri]